MESGVRTAAAKALTKVAAAKAWASASVPRGSSSVNGQDCDEMFNVKGYLHAQHYMNGGEFL